MQYLARLSGGACASREALGWTLTAIGYASLLLAAGSATGAVLALVSGAAGAATAARGAAALAATWTAARWLERSHKLEQRRLLVLYPTLLLLSQLLP